MKNVPNKFIRTTYSMVENRISYTQDHLCLDSRKKNLTDSGEKMVEKLAIY